MSDTPKKKSAHLNVMDYAVHSATEVKGFFGPYRFLSNFEPCQVYFEGQLYPSSENAYQAAKVIPEHREPFLTCSASESKLIWKMPELTQLYGADGSDWNFVKYDIMLSIVFEKFYRNRDFRRRLLETDRRYLEELNHWGDKFWGVDVRAGGANNLGLILMLVRKLWQVNPNHHG